MQKGKVRVLYLRPNYGSRGENGDEIEVELIGVVDKEERGLFGVCQADIKPTNAAECVCWHSLVQHALVAC